jgi:hypothetical protein
LKKTSGDNTEILIDVATIVNNHDFDLTDEELLELLKEAILHNLSTKFTGLHTFSFVFETKCTKTYHCYFKVKNETEVLCVDDGRSDEDIAYYDNAVSTTFLSIAHTKEIGIKCCTYDVVVDCDQPLSKDKVISKTNNDYPGSSCDSSLPDEYDCQTGELIPVNANCNYNN